jgi:hypothetical protein
MFACCACTADVMPVPATTAATKMLAAGMLERFI